MAALVQVVVVVFVVVLVLFEWWVDLRWTLAAVIRSWRR